MSNILCVDVDRNKSVTVLLQCPVEVSLTAANVQHLSAWLIRVSLLQSLKNPAVTSSAGREQELVVHGASQRGIAIHRVDSKPIRCLQLRVLNLGCASSGVPPPDGKPRMPTLE